MAGREPGPRLDSAVDDVVRLRQSLRNITDYLSSQPGLFPGKREAERLLPREEKEAVWGAWQRFLDVTIALETLERAHRPWAKADPGKKAETTLVGHAAFLAQFVRIEGVGAKHVRLLAG